MTYWLRGTAYAIVYDRPVYPGEAILCDPSFPPHAAIVDSIAAGEDCPLELVEAEHDPSLPPPNEHEEREREAAEQAERLAASHDEAFARQAGLRSFEWFKDGLERPAMEEDEPGDPSEYERKIEELKAQYDAGRVGEGPQAAPAVAYPATTAQAAPS